MVYKKDSTSVKGLNERKTDNNDLGDTFDNSRIANFSDDAIGVLGWKGTGLLLIALILGFGIFKMFVN